MTEAECIALKQQAFRKYFHSLNEQQQQAVFSVTDRFWCSPVPAAARPPPLSAELST